MGNRRTENKKRGQVSRRAIWDCPDCKACADGPDGGTYILGPDSWCDKHRCTAITRAGIHCQNSATYPDRGACGVHVSAVAA